MLYKRSINIILKNKVRFYKSTSVANSEDLLKNSYVEPIDKERLHIPVFMDEVLDHLVKNKENFTVNIPLMSLLFR
jgi:hypothetical protein